MIKPVGDKVLLRPLPKRTHTESGLILLEAYNDDRSQYVVEAAGPKVKYVKAGDMVYTPLHHDHFTLEDGTGRKLVPEEQLWMVFGRT